MPLCKVEPSKQLPMRGFTLVELPTRRTVGVGALLRLFNGVTASESSMLPKQPQQTHWSTNNMSNFFGLSRVPIMADVYPPMEKSCNTHVVSPKHSSSGATFSFVNIKRLHVVITFPLSLQVGMLFGIRYHFPCEFFQAGFGEISQCY